jgi:hypothetical protein
MYISDILRVCSEQTCQASARKSGVPLVPIVRRRRAPKRCVSESDESDSERDDVPHKKPSGKVIPFCTAWVKLNILAPYRVPSQERARSQEGIGIYHSRLQVRTQTLGVGS